MIDATILALKRTFILEALDLANVHMCWASQHLQDGRDENAVASFDRFVSAAKEAAAEMRSIRDAIATKKAMGEAAAEFRAQRTRSPASQRRDVSKPREAA